MPAASNTKMLAVWPLSNFHFASETKLALTLVPPDSVAAICGMEDVEMYGAVPPLTVYRAVLDEQYALNGSAVNDKVNGDTVKSVVAVVLRATVPAEVV